MPPIVHHPPQCQGVIADRNRGTKLAFLEDGTSLHLVLALSHHGKTGTGFKVKDVAPAKMPSENNPYASVSHVLCGNKKADGETCNKKVCAWYFANRAIATCTKLLLYI